MIKNLKKLRQEKAMSQKHLGDDEASFVEQYRKLSPAEKDSIKFVVTNYLTKQ